MNQSAYSQCQIARTNKYLKIIFSFRNCEYCGWSFD